MAKIRVHPIDDPKVIGFLEVIHHYWDDPYEPGAYHSIYPYRLDELPPGLHAFQTCVNYAHGLIAARDWAGLPAMINDICLACRYYDWGARLPRWNIYRGEEHPKYYPLLQDYPARLIPCFAQSWLDPAPPGYGQQP